MNRKRYFRFLEKARAERQNAMCVLYTPAERTAHKRKARKYLRMARRCRMA